MQVKITKGANLTRKQRDTILEDPRTINLTGELSTRQQAIEKKKRIARRKMGTSAEKRKNMVHLMTTITFLILIVSITIRVMSAPANAEETIQEAIQIVEQKEEVKQEDITEIIEIIQEEYKQEIIVNKPDHDIIEESTKFIKQFE